MARSREFEPIEALDKAMRLFWRKGYGATSVGDLVEATGVNRSGLYDEFESKKGLFLSALEHYRNVVTFRAIAPVERAGAGREEIRAFFHMLLEVSCTEGGRLGCLMTNTGSELAPYDKAVAREVAAFRTRLQQAFRSALINARGAGDIASDFDVNREADFLVGIMHSVALLARANASREMLANVITTALETLD